MWIDYSKMEGWELVKEIVVGGLEWVGFSKTDTDKLLCISSQKTTLIDCFSGEVRPCNCEYDEETRIAYCDELAIRSIDVFADRNTVNIDDLYANTIEILPVPTAEAFNSHELGNEFYACLISKEEFEQTWNGHYYYGKLDE